jgi:hypothetical protein
LCCVVLCVCVGVVVCWSSTTLQLLILWRANSIIRQITERMRSGDYRVLFIFSRLSRRQKEAFRLPRKNKNQ